MSRRNERDLYAALREGWPNRETHAAYIHLTADRGLAEKAVQSVAVAEAVHGTVSARRAGQILAGLLDLHLDELDDAGLVEEHQAISDDIGARARLNWTALGARFLGDRDAWQSMLCRCGCEAQA